MLAQNFKTPTELGISEVEVRALIGVLGMLERGELIHATLPMEEASRGMRKPRSRHRGLFNMEFLWAKTDCGTAACIAGTCDWLFKTKFTEDGRGLRDLLPNSLNELFCPPIISSQWREITSAQAATALRNYLTTGAPHWSEALAIA